jgi:hypothetical protein
VFLAAVFLLAFSSTAAAEKSGVVEAENSDEVTAGDDTLVLKVGDRLTGEIKSLERGKLLFDPEWADPVSVQWGEVAWLAAPHVFEVELTTGEKFFGTLNRGAEDETVDVRTSSGTVSLELEDVVRLVQIEGTRRDRLDGSLDFGFGFASANSSRSLSLDSKVRYRSRKSRRTGGFSARLFEQENAPRTREISLQGGLRRLLEDRRFFDTTLQFQRNEEQLLNLRSLVAVTYGRHVIQTNQMELDLHGGVAENIEDFDGSDQVESIELVGAIQYAFFTLSDPETDLRLSLLAYPSLSEPGRLRVEFEGRFKREIIEDFFWTISVTDKYDSDSPVEGTENNTWGLDSMIGWSF